jgi:1-acyl-sn-glycerol-3-phosphate acyltransferase
MILKSPALRGFFILLCFMRFLFATFFKLAGWKITGDVPREMKKYIIVVAPHSSNWDFLVGLAVRSILRFPSGFLAKEELFRPPFGWIFKKLDGHPVNRTKSENLVDQVAEIFRKEEQFVLAIAPEGTRKKVTRWKTGFYWIALKAQIPVVMAGLDYSTRTVTFSQPFYPDGDFKKDAAYMMHFFSRFKGKNRDTTPIL